MEEFEFIIEYILDNSTGYFRNNMVFWEELIFISKELKVYIILMCV